MVEEVAAEAVVEVAAVVEEVVVEVAAVEEEVAEAVVVVALAPRSSDKPNRRRSMHRLVRRAQPPTYCSRAPG